MGQAKSAEQVAQDIRRKTRCRFSAVEKISVDAVAHPLARSANLLAARGANRTRDKSQSVPPHRRAVIRSAFGVNSS
jgi:hypothetical protein